MNFIKEHIAIQCHNIPDADALASGFGLFRFFESKGNRPKFFYGGPPITKPNLTGMIEDLGIPVEHAPDLKEWDGLLVTIDSQHGAGNVMRVSAPRVAVIDHHIQEANLPALCDLRPWLGSCSTLVWNLLREADFSIDVRLGTALYYGLFTDTNGFSEVRHPLDRDMWDTLAVNQTILRKLKHSNLALSDLTLASAALKDLYFNADKRFVVISTPPCDPNLLGFVSDLAMQVDSVDLAVAYSEGSDGYKFSVRTAAREAKASELAAWLSKDIGSGGGHREKAGGYISKAKYDGRFGKQKPQAYFDANLKKYLEAFRIMDCENPTALADAGVDVTAMKVYRKLPARLGFVPCRKLFEGSADLQIRMLEGDVDITANEETVLMIGVKGEVYPIELAKFIESYTPTGESFALEFPYSPTVLNKNTGTRLTLPEHASVCVSAGTGTVRAARLEHHVKIFTRWDPENYLRGDPSDWIAARSPGDLYVVTADVFGKLYIRDCTGEDVSLQKGALRVVKKNYPVPVTFARETGTLQTREGKVSYERGDALLTGLEGESWPVAREYFFKVYVPASASLKPGQNGSYLKKEITPWAVRMEESFVVELPGKRGVLRGAAGDWLLQYAPNEYGVVDQEIFKATYVWARKRD